MDRPSLVTGGMAEDEGTGVSREGAASVSSGQEGARLHPEREVEQCRGSEARGRGSARMQAGGHRPDMGTASDCSPEDRVAAPDERRVRWSQQGWGPPGGCSGAAGGREAECGPRGAGAGLDWHPHWARIRAAGVWGRAEMRSQGSWLLALCCLAGWGSETHWAPTVCEGQEAHSTV